MFGPVGGVDVKLGHVDPCSSFEHETGGRELGRRTTLTFSGTVQRIRRQNGRCSKAEPPPHTESVVSSTIARVTPPIQSPTTVVDSTARSNERGCSVHDRARQRSGGLRERRSGRGGARSAAKLALQRLDPKRELLVLL